MTDPRALCAAEEAADSVTAGDIANYVTRRRLYNKLFLAGVAWARHAAGPPESPAPKVGQSICEHGNPEPLTCKKCQEPASPPPEGFPPRVWVSIAGATTWMEKPTSSDPGFEAMEYISLEEHSALLAEKQAAVDSYALTITHADKRRHELETALAEAKQQGRAWAFLRAARHARIYWGDAVANQLEAWFQECSTTPSKGAVDG